jgi:polyhydroxyalkanoate synthesis regulator phasin
MPSNDGFRKYIEAGAVLGQVTRARAEEIVRDLVGAGEVQRGQAQHWVDELVEKSRKASEQFLDLIRHEVTNQLDNLDPKQIDDLAKRVSEVLKYSAGVGRAATTDAANRASATATAAKKAATKVTGKRSAPKKTAPAKKATARPAAKKTAPAKKTAKKSTAKKAPVKKSAAKKTTAKKAPAKKAASN